MKSLTLEELRELAPGYVMGTLSSDELAFFNASLTDPVIAGQLAPEIAAHRAAMEFLATEQAVTPPPSLKARLAARIGQEQTLLARQADTAEMPIDMASGALSDEELDPESEIAPEVAADIAPVLNVLRGTPGGGQPAVTRATRFTPARTAVPVVRTRSTAAWATSGVFALALAASLFFAFNLRAKLDGLQQQLSDQQRLAKRTAERLAFRDSTVNALTHAENDLVLVRLAANDAKAHSMQVFWNKRTGEAVVHASGFDQVPKDRTYCLWIIRNGKPEAVTLFNPDADGHRLINAVPLPRDAAGITAMAVTEEPAAGSPQPTMTPFLVGAVAPK
jgi:hypothetical protein